VARTTSDAGGHLASGYGELETSHDISITVLVATTVAWDTLNLSYLRQLKTEADGS
jgi:hypothetical protein